MPDKDFEERVRERLGELSLEPSSTIRASTLEAVRQRRRRRAFFWIPLLLGLLLVGAWGAWKWGAFQGHRGTAVAPTAMPTPIAVTPAPPAAPTASVPTSPSPAAAAAPPAATISPAAAPGAATPARGAASTATPAPGGPSAAPEPRPDLTLSAGGVFIKTGPPDMNDRVRAPRQMPKPKGKIRKWSLTVYGGAGLSGQGAFGSFHTPAGVQWVSTPTSASTGPNTTGNRGGYYDSLAGVKAMAGFQLGFLAEFPLSKTLCWGLGVEYDFSKTRVGPVVQSTLYTYLPGSVSYGGNRGIPFDNRYGLLSVPLDLTWESHRLWSLSIGLVPAYLVSVHALEYNPEGGYLDEKDLFLRWHLSGEAALSLNFWQFRGWALSGGPFFRYDFQSLQRNAPVSDHLNSLELRLALTRSFKKVSHEK